MGRVRSPHPYGLRKYLTMPDGATATFDLFEPQSEHCTGGQLNSCWLHIAANLDSVLWGEMRTLLLDLAGRIDVNSGDGRGLLSNTNQHGEAMRSSCCIPVSRTAG